MVNLPICEGELSCGLFGLTEDFSEKYLSLDEKFMRNKESTFFVRAGGDSMSPEIKAQDILIVDRKVPIFSGAIAAFFYNGNAICKQYMIQDDQIILHSINSKYKDIIVSESDSLELFGVVIGLARDFL